jgi:hypothetical protein
VKYTEDNTEYADFSEAYTGSPEAFLQPRPQALEDVPEDVEDEADAADWRDESLTELERLKRQDQRREQRAQHRTLTYAEAKRVFAKNHPILPGVTTENAALAVAQHLSSRDPAQDRAMRLYRYLEHQRGEPHQESAIPSQQRLSGGHGSLGRGVVEVQALNELPWMTPFQEQSVKEKVLVERLSFRRNTGRDDASVLSDEKTLHALNWTEGDDYREGSSVLSDELRQLSSTRRKSTAKGSSARAFLAAAGSSNRSSSVHNGGSGSRSVHGHLTRGVTSDEGGAKWCSVEDEEHFQHSSSPMKRIHNVQKRIALATKTRDDGSSSSDSEDSDAVALSMMFRGPRQRFDPDAATFSGIDFERYDPDL